MKQLTFYDTLPSHHHRNAIDDNLDIYKKVYNINQQAHKALVPLRDYCLKDDV